MYASQFNTSIPYRVIAQKTLFYPAILYTQPTEDWNEIKKRLDNWATINNQANKSKNYQTAADRIWDAGKNKKPFLDLTKLYIKNLPPEIGTLTSLKGIDLSENFLSELPAEFGRLTNLKSINLNNNNTIALPKVICSLPKLEFLSVALNQLNSLPEEIGNLKNLMELSFARNHLSTLPAGIGQLVNLVMLNLNHNKFATLPDYFENLQKLAVLHLDDNEELENLPNSVACCRSLLHVSRDHTKIPHLIGSWVANHSETQRNNQRIYN